MAEPRRPSRLSKLSKRERAWLQFLEREQSARRRRPITYRVFISHRYSRSAEYRRLVAMLDRAAQRDPSWRWENLSIPMDQPIMTKKQAEWGEVYAERIGRRVALAHVVLYVAHDDWLDNVNSLYLELVEGTFRAGRKVPIVSVVPPGEDPGKWKQGLPGEVMAKWRTDAIIEAIVMAATPAIPSELALLGDERAERRRLVAALDASGWDPKRTARKLGVSLSTLRWNARRYLIQ